jgi:hypothetical protein
LNLRVVIMLTRAPVRFLIVAAACVSWGLPPVGLAADKTVRAVGGDLQAALDAARSGDVILLDPGGSYVGNFVLPAKEGDGFITLQTAIDPRRVSGPEGRIAIEEAGLLAKIQSPNAAPALQTAPGAHHWRLTLLEIQGNGGGDLVRLGDGSAAQNSVEKVPHHLIIDRCYIHGDRVSGQKRGIALNSASTTIINSHISDIGAGGLETHAIAGWNGPGPYVIENNYLEAAGVNLMLGGTDPAIRGLVPTDVLIRWNRFVKRPEWRREKRWVVKNLLELKNARQVTVEWNVLEYAWEHGQTGSAIVLKSWNQSGRAPWSVVEEVAVRYNVIRHAGSVFNILGRSYEHPSGLTRGVTIEHNLAYDISAKNWGGHGRFILVGGGAADLTVDHNTSLQDGTFLHVYGEVDGRPQPVLGMRVTNNLALHNAYGIKGDERGIGNDTIASFFPGGLFQRNVLAGGSARAYPPGNDFPAVADLLAQFEDPAANDYRLKQDSRYRRGATDAGPMGADVDRLLRCLGGSRLDALGPARPATGLRAMMPEPGDPNPAGCPPSAGASERVR